MCRGRKVLLVILTIVASLSLGAAPKTFSSRRNKVQKVAVDSTSRQVVGDVSQRRKMSNSAFPVQISITGRAVQIHSDHNQILPIYTESGTFYMIMKVTKGTNWLTGLPRGRYFINNRPISIGI